jgi:hypothetical protein
MGLLSRLRDALSNRARTNDSTLPPAAPAPPVRLDFPGADPLVTLSGTTTFGRDAIERMLARRGLVVPAHVEVEAVLHRETDNPADPSAVAVLVEGERVGHLPHHVATSVALPATGAQRAVVQLFANEQDGVIRAAGWVWLDDSPPRWRFGANNWPAVTREETRAVGQRSRREMVAEALHDGGDRAEQFRAGMVDGVHFLELVEPIKQLKREGRNEEALQLCYVAIAGAEGECVSEGLTPPPWYTEQAAIILRKLRRCDEEIAVLRRYLGALTPEERARSKIAERLRKLQPDT